MGHYKYMLSHNVLFSVFCLTFVFTVVAIYAATISVYAASAGDDAYIRSFGLSTVICT